MNSTDRNWVQSSAYTDMSYILNELLDEIDMDLSEFEARITDPDRVYYIDHASAVNNGFHIAKVQEDESDTNVFVKVEIGDGEITVSSSGIPDYPNISITAAETDSGCVYIVNESHRVLQIWQLSRFILYPLLFGRSVIGE